MQNQQKPKNDQDPNKKMLKQFLPLFFADGGLDEQIAVLAAGQGPLAEAAKKLREGNVKEAETLVQKAAATAPAAGNAWHLFLLADIHRRGGDKDAARKALRQAAGQKGAEARVKLWAWNALRELGEEPDQATGREVLGVIFEVPQDRGLDLLAVYAESSARYINLQAGHMVVWETPDKELEKRIREVLKAAQPLAERYPVQKRSDEPVRADRVRFTFLTCKGNRVAEVNQTKAGELDPLFRSRAMVLQFITEKQLQKK